jgi:precorrin-2/cobalt-factor-2 C20-methyltransferase
MSAATGTLIGVGVGPGDPELVTLKAARLLGQARVIAYFCKKGGEGRAQKSALPHLPPAARHLAFAYPMTIELPHDDARYGAAMTAFYDSSAETVAAELDNGTDVIAICEGDPFFYGSFMHLYLRLKDRYPTRCIAGVTGMSGCWTAAMTPMTFGDDVLTVLPGTLDEASLTDRLSCTDAAVIMKLGSHFPKVRRALEAAGRLDAAIYVERGSHADQHVEPMAARDLRAAPYFSIILVPGQGRRY